MLCRQTSQLGFNYPSGKESCKITKMKDLVSEIRSIIESARTNAVRSVDFCRVQMYLST